MIQTIVITIMGSGGAWEPLFVMIITYALASLYLYEKKRTKNTIMNTRQTDNDLENILSEKIR